MSDMRISPSSAPPSSSPKVQGAPANTANTPNSTPLASVTIGGDAVKTQRRSPSSMALPKTTDADQQRLALQEQLRNAQPDDRPALEHKLATLEQQQAANLIQRSDDMVKQINQLTEKLKHAGPDERVELEHRLKQALGQVTIPQNQLPRDTNGDYHPLVQQLNELRNN